MGNTSNLPYEYMGYYCDKIVLNKSQKSSISNVEIGVDSFFFDEDQSLCSIGLKVELNFDDSNGNVIGYVAGFRIFDQQMKDLFLKNGANILDNIKKESEESERTNRIISFLLSSAFPFVRQHIFTLTSDMNEPVLIPTIDIRTINLSIGVNLKHRKKAVKRAKIGD